MAGLRELRKRLKSVRTTVSLPGRCAPSQRRNIRVSMPPVFPMMPMRRPAGKCSKPPGYTGRRPMEGTDEKPRCFVLFSSNRGLCGGFNAELLNLFYSRYREAKPTPLVIACGKMAVAFCREKEIALEQEILLDDVPLFEQAQQLAARLKELYASGAVSGVDILYQRFENMLRQTARHPAGAAGCGRWCAGGDGGSAIPAGS